jgi:hypothetical protein
MINKLLKVIAIMLVVFVTAFNSYSQNPTYLMEIKNDSLISPTEYIFDVYIKNTSVNPTWATSFQLQGIQFGIKLNNQVLSPGDSILPTIVSGFSDMLPANQHTNANLTMSGFTSGVPNANYGIKMTGKAATVGNGTMILTTEMRVCRIKLKTKLQPFVANKKFNFIWSFTTTPWQTKVTVFLPAATDVTVQANHLINNLSNPLLNTPPVKYNVTGTASYCQGSGANVGLDNSELGVRYQLYKDNLAFGAPVIGTGSALTWTNNTFGNYIVIASRIATAYSDTMNNTAVLTEAVGLPGIAGSITGNATICQGNPGETYTVPVITNTENYVWEYSGTGVTINGTTNTAVVNFSSNATSGNLTVKGQNACGLGTISTPLSIVLSNLPDPAGVITGVSTVSPGQTAVAYSVPVINGATTYTWIYSGLGATINGNSNAITIDFGANATPGFLTVKGTNPCGNGIVSADFAVNVNSIPGAAGTIMGVSSVCPGQNNVIFTVPAILGADTYLWEYSGTGVTIDSILGDTAYINFAMNATSGNLTVKGHNTFGYGGVSSNFAITVNSFPDAAGLISGLDTVCKNTNNIVFSVPAILYATNYVWTLPTGATGTSTTNSISVNFGATAVNGNITVKGTNVCGDGVLSTKAVVINTVPSGAGTISGLSPVCQGTNNLTYTVPSISGATSYIWTLPAGVTGTSTTNSIIANVSLTSTGGQITVKGSNACGNGTASAMSLTVNPLPSAAGVITGLNTVCQGQSGVTYSVPSITNATSYIWTKPNFATGSSTTNTITLAYPTNAVSGDVTVKGNNACGQGAVSTRSIVVNPLPDTAQAITGLATVCKGITGVVYKVPTINNATSYAWTLPTGVVGTSSVDSIIVDFTSTSVSGNITVKGVNACGDGVSKSFAITVNDVPVQAGTIAGNASVCQGQNGITYTIPVITGASSYIWTIPSGFTGTSTTNSILVNIAANANSGNITVKGSNTCGDGLSSILPVTVNSTPDTAGVIAGAITVCQGQTSVTYTVPAINNATSYQWTLPAGASGSSTTNSITLNYASFAVSGNLKVKGQNACGFGQESLLAITVNPLPSNGGTIIGNALVCKGQTLTYKVPAINNANSYVWTYPSGFTGSSTVDSIVLVVGVSAVSGTITVKGQNACGVSSVASSKTVTVNSVPAAPGTITGNSNVCQGAQNETYSISAVSGATSYSWNLPSGATGSSTSTNILVNFGSTASSGNIVVKASNVCGTGDSTFKMITVNSIPVAAGTISGSTTVCQGATGQVYSIPAITGATSYIWTLPAGVTGTSTTNTITVSFANNTAAGSISVYGSNACGDGSPSSIAFTITALPGAAGTITSVGGDSIVAAGTKTYTVPAITGATSYIWTYSGTGATITGTTNTVSISFLSNFTNGSLTVMGQNACGNGTVSAGYFITNYVGINDPDGNSLNYSIYPNPTKGIITVNINGINSNLELQITNLQGEIIRTENLTNNKQSYSADIDLSAYAKGVYFVKFINNKFVKVEKIVLQ